MQNSTNYHPKMLRIVRRINFYNITLAATSLLKEALQMVEYRMIRWMTSDGVHIV
jgi:hypothetical protein